MNEDCDITLSMQLRNPKEVSKEDYNEFYKKTFNEYLEPLASSHFTTEVRVLLSEVPSSCVWWIFFVLMLIQSSAGKHKHSLIMSNFLESPDEIHSVNLTANIVLVIFIDKCVGDVSHSRVRLSLDLYFMFLRSPPPGRMT